MRKSISTNNKQLHHALFRLCTSYPSQSAVLILNIVRDKEREEDDRSQAKYWLLRRAGEAAAKVLLPYLHDAEVEVRRLTANMLYHLQDKQMALPLLFTCLQDDASDVRRIAARHLGSGRWEDRQIAERLAACLQAPDPLVRVQAAESLGKLGIYVGERFWQPRHNTQRRKCASEWLMR